MRIIVVVGDGNTGKTTRIHNAVLGACESLKDELVVDGYSVRWVHGEPSKVCENDLKHEMRISACATADDFVVKVCSKGDSPYEVSSALKYCDGADVAIIATRKPDWVKITANVDFVYFDGLEAENERGIVDLTNKIVSTIKGCIG